MKREAPFLVVAVILACCFGNVCRADGLPPVPVAADVDDAISAQTTNHYTYDDSDGSYDDRLSVLEKAWADMQKAEKEKEEKAASEPSLDISGRIHLDTWSFPDDSPGIHYFENPATGIDPEDRIFFRRIRLRFQGDILENMLYRMQIDFNAPDAGEMKDMYIGFTELPFFQRILIGNQKRPLGLDHLNSSRYNIFIERPLVVEAFNEDARRVGVAAYGVSEDEVYNWRWGAYALENMVRDGKIIGDARQWSLNARLASSPWYDEACGGVDYFHWAVAGMFARPDGDANPLDTNRNEGRFRTRSELRSDTRWLNTGRIPGAQFYEILGLESILNLGPFQVVGEYQVNWMQRDDKSVGTGPDLFFHGAYIYFAYMLTGEHVPYDRRTSTIGRVKPFRNFFVGDCPECGGEREDGWGAWQIAARYSYLDLTDKDVMGGINHNLTLALVWYFNPYASMQFNTVFGDIRDRFPVAGMTDGHFTAIGTRLRIDF